MTLQLVNQRVPKDNTLVLLNWASNSKRPSVQWLSEEYRRILVSLLWRNHLQNGLHEIVSFNSKVLTQSFMDKFYAIFRNRNLPVFYDGSEISNKGVIEDMRGRPLIKVYSRWHKMITKHHMVPGSRWGVSADSNYRYIPHTLHSRFHRIFSNKTPLEQLAYLILLERNSYNPWFIEDIADLLLWENQEKAYKKRIIPSGRLTY